MIRLYGRFLNQEKHPLPPRYYVMENYVQTNTNELENNLKIQVCTSDFQDKVKEVVTEYWDFFVRMDSGGISGDFHSRLTQVDIHLPAVNHLGMVLVSLR